MSESLTNRIINAQILQPPTPPRDAWALGTVSGTPSGGIAAVVVDGDSAASNCAQAVACSDSDRVLTVLLGRSRIVAANLTTPAGAGSGGSMTAAQILAALVTVDGAGSGLDADLLDGSHASAFAAASHQHAASDITSGTLGVARGGTGIDSYTTGNYIRAAGTTSLEQRTPSQVLSDIGAAAATHNHDTSYVKVGDYEDADVLAKLLNVDGSGSGLDADKLDGNESTRYGEGSWSTWTPTLTAGGSMTISSIVLDYARYRRVGRLVLVKLHATFTLGGTAHNDILWTLPVTAEDSQQGLIPAMCAQGTNPFAGISYPNTTSQWIIRKYDTSTWTLGTGRQVWLSGFYSAAS